MALTANDVQHYFIGFFGRPADPVGLNFWKTQDKAAILDTKTGFAGSLEFTNQFVGLSDTQKVTKVYANLLGRIPDAEGLIYWAGELTAGRETIGSLVTTMIDAALSKPSKDNTTITDRTSYATSFTEALNTAEEINAYGGTKATEAARKVLATVVSATKDDHTTYDAALKAVDATILAITNNTTTTASQDITLTTGQDTVPGGNGNDFFRGVAGTTIGTQDQSTLNSSDVLDGREGQDKLVVLLNGPYGGGATIKNIETLQIGTNTIPAAAAAAIAFDYNVNNGAYEVTGVNTVIYDQITTGESLTINNLTPTSTTAGIPTLSWENEAGSRAGTVGVTYRQASVAGTTDNQNVALKNVNAMNAADGILNVGGGVETITINSTGTVTNNTLNNSGNADTGNNAVAADVISAGTLTKVVLTGDVANGKAAGVVTDTTGNRAASIGQTDRVVASDMGLTIDATTNATESNLLSVGARVTEVDASAATAAVNVRFVAKNDASATNVTFKGGKASDYVEFENGNINATGGEGDDSFAFINAQANGTFGEGDTIDGGTGADTIQIGLNGNAQTYNISETELRNKSSIGTIDLRGQTVNLTLSSDFVAKADTPDSIAIRTDKIIQSSATSAINPTAGANNGTENLATDTVNLTKLTSNQAVSYTGGSGSDRVILSDATYNVLKTLVGGGNEGQAIAAGAARYDTVTLVTNGENVVIDAQDLSTTSGFEGFVLTKNATAATYNITLTQAFLNNNTLAADDANTGITETNFQIGTSKAANNAALAVGDTVTIDVRNLLDTTDTGRAAGFTTRTFDVSSLENAGAAVTFIGNTGNLTLAQVRAAGVAVANGASANAADVTGASAAVPVGTTGITFTSGIAAQTNVLGSNNNDIFNLTQADTVASGSGNDTVNLSAAVAPIVSLGAGAVAGTNTQSATEVAALAGAATPAARATLAASYADTVNISTAAPGAMDILTTDGAGSVANISVDVGAVNLAGRLDGFDTVNFTAVQAAGVTLSNFTDTVTANAGGVFTLGDVSGTLTSTGAAGTGVTFTGSGTAAYTVTGGAAAVAGADFITITSTGAAIITGGAGIDTINVTGNTGVSTIAFNDVAIGTGIVAAVNRDVVTGFSTVNDIIQLDLNQTTAGTLAGANAIVQAVGAAGAPVAFNTAVADVLALNFDMGGASSVLGSDLTGAALLANLGGALTVTLANNLGYIVAYDNGNAYLYAVADAGAPGDGAITAGEIALIGTFNGVAVGALAAANLTIGT